MIYYSYGSYKHGIWTLRLFRFAMQLKAPWNVPIFSERYGYTKRLWLVGGWRLLFHTVKQ